jgi:hypothetical protein
MVASHRFIPPGQDEALVFADYSEEMGDFFYPWRFPMGLPHFSRFNELQKSGTLNRSTENQQISASYT